jgi:transposase InsO family protein
VEEARVGLRSRDGSEGTEIDGPDRRGRGDGRRLPKAYAVAARRLPLRAPADDSSSDALVPSSLPAAPWDLKAAVEGEASPKRKFKANPIGYFHIDIAEVRTAQGKLYLIVAIDRASKFAYVELHEKVARSTAADFLRRLIEAISYQVHTVLTDNGTHFIDPAGECWCPAEIREMIANRQPFRAHAFDYACALNDIDHRLTKPRHPWTNGQVERMNRTLKDAQF